ncbi:hypothetical protein H2O64_06110 [Kordia sp. YSTF-M3]|uniref:Lipoprotein n=1 Tax=Kordia aestuariivivens TaxID=2759037 RepID=A0ABR7Q727_9FLAO|nr:hypothetical protein [Kordia aestuariivivens]MBC8754238.1 hypothetical protein [Kordia aestuariivivens]
MQKVMTVKIVSFLVLILLITISCQKDTQNDDIKILEIVLQEKQNQSNKAVFLDPIGKSNTTLDFFNLRKKKNRTFTIEYQDSISPNDTLTQRKGKTVYKDLEITQNNYIAWGKGVDKKTEGFLKDSFNYKDERTINWTLPKTLNNILLKKEGSEKGKKIRVSAPIYNLDKNKAVLFTFEQSYKSTVVQSIYFVKKNNAVWDIIYTESQVMFLDLKIELTGQK